jgi:hypothetical protein
MAQDFVGLMSEHKDQGLQMSGQAVSDHPFQNRPTAKGQELLGRSHAGSHAGGKDNTGYFTRV